MAASGAGPHLITPVILMAASGAGPHLTTPVINYIVIVEVDMTFLNGC